MENRQVQWHRDKYYQDAFFSNLMQNWSIGGRFYKALWIKNYSYPSGQVPGSRLSAPILIREIPFPLLFP